MEERFQCSPTSIKNKLKFTICGCFRHFDPNDHYDHLPDELSPASNRHNHHHHRHLTRTSSAGGNSSSPAMRSSKSEEFNLRDKCRNLMSRMSTATPRGHQHRKSHSSDFHYDPLSYALNFEEYDAYEDDFPFRNFSSRLPSSPRPPLRSISDGLVDKGSSSNQAVTTEPVSAPPPPREISAYS